MASNEKEDVYATLLLNDTYLPGALVLAHSLRDAGATKKLAVLVTTETVSAEVIAQLRIVYDHVISVTRIQNRATPANLDLMSRPDLHSAFTKIHLWNQTQFRRIVYLDADVVAIQAPEELFALEQAFSAAPDIGWPDLFNTGVMVLTPNQSDYEALKRMAEKGESFDGADQGLLNLHFKDYNRLSFAYNVTPSAHYQYLPAYLHFQSSIKLVHFIGSEKPWISGRTSSHSTSNPAYNAMVNKWWSIYDKHYNRSSNPADIIQFFVKGEYQPTVTRTLTSSQPSFSLGGGPPMPVGSWNAQHQPPPVNSRAEAPNFPHPHYRMSRDTAPFVPPRRYPSPPRNMYNVPEQQKPSAVFPWETYQNKPARTFEESGTPPSTVAASTSGSTAGEYSDSSEPATPTTVTSVSHTFPASDPWATFSRANAWDEIPQIERYVENIQKQHQMQQRRQWARGQVATERQNLTISTNVGSVGSKVTDFPTAVERPSLPVTPAPVHRVLEDSGLLTEGNDANSQLPAAVGVPPQSDWDPAERLQRLAEQQSDVLLKKFGQGALSEEVVSPQPIRPSGLETSSVRNMDDGNINKDYAIRMASRKIQEPAYSGPGLAFEKDEGYPEQPSGHPAGFEQDVLET